MKSKTVGGFGDLTASIQPQILNQDFEFNIYIIVIFSVDCIWSQWSQWATCSETCGGGTHHRSRDIDVPALNGGAACGGSDSETQTCNTECCPQGGDSIAFLPFRAIFLGTFSVHFLKVVNEIQFKKRKCICL